MFKYSLKLDISLQEKVSVFGVFLARIFPHSNWIRTRKTPNTDTFYVVYMIIISGMHYLSQVFLVKKVLIPKEFLEAIVWRNFLRAGGRGWCLGKLQTEDFYNSIKRKLHQASFPVNLTVIFTTIIFNNNSGTLLLNPFIAYPGVLELSLRKKCPDTEFFLVRTWTLFTQCLPNSSLMTSTKKSE